MLGAMLPSLLESQALLRASDPRQSPRNPRQRLCRGLPSAKTSRRIFRQQRDLCRRPFIGHSTKPLPKARTALDKKSSRHDAVGSFFVEDRPSANKWFFYFFFKTFVEVSSLPLSKVMFRIFQTKNLCRGPWLLASAKIIIQQKKLQ